MPAAPSPALPPSRAGLPAAAAMACQHSLITIGHLAYSRGIAARDRPTGVKLKNAAKLRPQAQLDRHDVACRERHCDVACQQWRVVEREHTYPAAADGSPPRRMAAWRRGVQPKATSVGTAAVPCRITSAAASSCTPSTTVMSHAAQLSWKLCSSPRPWAAAEDCLRHEEERVSGTGVR